MLESGTPLSALVRGMNRTAAVQANLLVCLRRCVPGSSWASLPLESDRRNRSGGFCRSAPLAFTALVSEITRAATVTYPRSRKRGGRDRERERERERPAVLGHGVTICHHEVEKAYFRPGRPQRQGRRESSLCSAQVTKKTQMGKIAPLPCKNEQGARLHTEQ